MTCTLEFAEVSKRYLLGGFRGSLREAIPNTLRRWTGKPGRSGAAELWALREVTFQVESGEAVAIIGPNGAGKTTTLKLATWVTQPTSGKVLAHGRTSSLIELGAGFHPDLTGRGNIHLNGTILGLKRREIEQRFAAIAEFSELEAFLDTPVKRYSSGMYARLGFAVAAHVDPDILVVDEVLAVGDLAFQSKCLARMAEMKRSGTTIVIVSHQLPRVRRLCDRGIFLYRGQVIFDGPIEEAITTYQNNPQYASGLRAERPSGTAVSHGGPSQSESAISPNSPMAITGVSLFDGSGCAVDTCQTGGRLVVRISFVALGPVKRPVFEVWIHAADGTEFAALTTQWDGYFRDNPIGPGYVDLVLDPLSLVPGRYTISAAITASDGVTRYDWHWQRYGLNVQADRYLQGLVYLPHTWDSAHDPAACPEQPSVEDQG